MKQADAILEYLKDGHHLTALDALRLFGCLRLGGRIFELRERGYTIDGPLVKIGKKHVARYTLRA